MIALPGGKALVSDDIACPLSRCPEWDVDYDNAAMAHTSSVRGWGKLPVTTG